MADNELAKKLIAISENDDIKFNSKFIQKQMFCVKLILLLIATLHVYFLNAYILYILIINIKIIIILKKIKISTTKKKNGRLEIRRYICELFFI